MSSQLHSFLGAEKNADGTSKYDTAAIPTSKLAEFAKLPTAAEAYRAASDYLTQGGGGGGGGSNNTNTAPRG